MKTTVLGMARVVDELMDVRHYPFHSMNDFSKTTASAEPQRRLGTYADMDFHL